MNCKKCGSEIPENATTCPKCGASATDTTAPAAKKFDFKELLENIKALLKPAQLPPRTPEIEALAAGPTKSRMVYILLALFLGGFGVHNFYAGYRSRAVASLVCCVIPPCCGVTGIIATIGLWIDIFTMKCDAAGRPLQ